MSRVAVVGLGRMGRGMAGRLLAAGHEVVVTNRTPGTAPGLLTDGARWADTPRQAAESADAVLVMVSDDDASRAVWLGADGVLTGAVSTGAVVPGALAIECSTLSREWVLELADAVSATGMRYLDAPVTGLPEAAAAGRLTLLLGGDAGVVEAAAPVLEPLSAQRLHFGPVGAGTAYKLMVNLMGAVQIAAAAEGLALAERAGLDLALVAQALAGSQAASPQVVRTSRRMVDGHHAEVVFSGRLRRKDADYAVRLAEQLGLGVPLGRVALAGLDRLVAAGLAELNETAVIEVARSAPPDR